MAQECLMGTGRLRGSTFNRNASATNMVTDSDAELDETTRPNYYRYQTKTHREDMVDAGGSYFSLMIRGSKIKWAKRSMDQNHNDNGLPKRRYWRSFRMELATHHEYLKLNCRALRTNRLRDQNAIGFDGAFIVEAQGHKVVGLALLWQTSDEVQIIDILTIILIASYLKILTRTIDFISIYGFQKVLSDCSLNDLPLLGYQFTWERGHGSPNWIEARIDRALASHSWLDNFQLARLLNIGIDFAPRLSLAWILASRLPLLNSPLFASKCVDW
uniref:RNase H type-1 domain-containing protein n=1 Tax=Cannabis sativa TaxID=3483 RepID=A0A803PJN2_CANSA